MDDERIELLAQLERFAQALLPSLALQKKHAYSSSPQTYLQSLIDDALFRAETSIAHVFAVIRHERNFMSPVSSLPPDILHNIFCYGTLADTLRASWVSRVWRQVAINTPSLWTHLDWNMYKTSEFRALQLSRCGTLALDLTLPAPPGPLELYLPQQALPRDLLSRAYSISNLPTTESLESVDISGLQSLHLCRGSYDAHYMSKMQLNTTHLRHLCLELTTSDFTRPRMSLPSLETLHIHMRIPNFDLVLKWVAELPWLQELYIHCRLSLSNQHDVKTARLITLKRLYLIEAPQYFQELLLDHIILSDYTHLEISPLRCSSRSGLSCLPRQIATHSLWIDQTSGLFIYDHGTSTTKITGTKATFSLFCGLPDITDLDNIATLIVHRGPPPTFNDLHRLINLTSLALTFHPGSIFEPGGLAETLNEELVKNCPRLDELILVRGESSFNDEVRPAETVISFLRTWLSEYQVVFGTLRVSNAISPQTWSDRREIFDSMTVLFELREIDLQSRMPRCPEPRRFVTKSSPARNPPS
ncbi:SubName: Full=Uncharacterized protein {ECO:0000313/EMBL:CCA75307.1} [Serendipita indica DSM 11827]|nr:SubName: Full=Uncharacterized protein {ECO:0000313/EMBL:CCA75307.1} [Serendipita indica DSM 11827]